MRVDVRVIARKILVRPRILEMSGMRLSDFKTHAEALKTADELAAQNKAEFGYDVEPIPHSNPLMTKVWYVQGHGLKRKWEQTETKTLTADASVKDKKALEDSNGFVEGLGLGVSGASSTAVKVENVAYKKMNQFLEPLRPFQ